MKLKEAQVIHFSYVKKNGEEKEYLMEVVKVADNYIDGNLLNGEGFRRFIRDNMSSIEESPLNAPTAEELEEENPGSEEEEEVKRNGYAPSH